MDFVEILEVNTKRSLGMFCGNEKPEAQSTLGPMAILFKTDVGVSGRGFQAKFSVSRKC